MKCTRCGRELDDTVSFCPFCGEKIQRSGAGDETPLYQTEVKMLRKSCRLNVYRDRTELVISSVQKMVFPYASVAAVKEGMNHIHFVMEDGRIEACAVNRKDIHRAFYEIEQAVRPYLEMRNRRLESEGVLCSFPSSPAGLGGVLSSGILSIMEDRTEYRSPSGKDETISYTDVKAARVASKGVLEYLLYDGTKKSFTADKDRCEEAAAFLQSALQPFIEQRKEQLLSQGILFSFQRGKSILNLYADRLEYQSENGTTGQIPFRDIRTAHVFDASLEASLTNGTIRTFPVDREAADAVNDFLKTALAPHVELRTKGFDLVCGLEERLELNDVRGVFHVIRQGGREISREYRLQELSRAEAVETKARKDLLGTLFAGRKNGDAEKNEEEKIAKLEVLLTVGKDQDEETVPVCLGSFPFGTLRSSAEYEQCASEQARLFSYLKERCPDCVLVLPEPPTIPEERLDAPEEKAVSAADAASGNAPEEETDARESEKPARKDHADSLGLVEKSQFGHLLDGISDFVGKCGTPMTIAISGDWETGSGSFLRMIYSTLKESGWEPLLWLPVWQFSQSDADGSLSLRLAGRLIGLLPGAGRSGRERAKMLLQDSIKAGFGFMSQGATDGQGFTDAIFKNGSADPLEQKIRLFSEQVKKEPGQRTGRSSSLWTV